MFSSQKGFMVGLWIIAALIFAYVLYRGINLSLTHDEAYTYTRYVHHEYEEILTYKTGNVLPNNHLLNTVAQKYFSEKYGPSEPILRLPSFIACVVFLLASVLMSGVFTGIQRLSAFAILVLHPYVLDFMLLSRGYGMAIACMFLSLYLIVWSIKENFDPLIFGAGLVSAGVAVVANFSWLTFFAVLCPAYLLLQVLFTKGKWWLRILKVLISIGAILICVQELRKWITEPLTVIMERKLLFGGTNGFWTDTVRSLSDRLAYGAGYKEVWMIFIQFLIVLTLCGAVACIILLIRNRKLNSIRLSLMFLFLVIVGMFSATVIQVQFMGSFYPEERTALVYLPVFLVLMIYVAKDIQDYIADRGKSVNWILPAIAIVFALHMINSVNFKYVLDWKYDANTREIAHDIESMPESILLGVHPFYQPAMEYYRRTHKLSRFGELHVDGYRRIGDYDYYVIPEVDSLKVEEDGLEIRKVYLPSTTILASAPFR